MPLSEFQGSDSCEGKKFSKNFIPLFKWKPCTCSLPPAGEAKEAGPARRAEDSITRVNERSSRRASRAQRILGKPTKLAEFHSDYESDWE